MFEDIKTSLRLLKDHFRVFSSLALITVIPTITMEHIVRNLHFSERVETISWIILSAGGAAMASLFFLTTQEIRAGRPPRLIPLLKAGLAGKHHQAQHKVLDTLQAEENAYKFSTNGLHYGNRPEHSLYYLGFAAGLLFLFLVHWLTGAKDLMSNPWVISVFVLGEGAIGMVGAVNDAEVSLSNAESLEILTMTAAELEAAYSSTGSESGQGSLTSTRE